MMEMERMRPLTEQEIRLMVKRDEGMKSLTVAKGTLVTPAALEYLRMMDISLVRSDTPEDSRDQRLPAVSGEAPHPSGERQAVVFYGPNGESFDSKPEAMTHLLGNNLVYKDHPIIVWRGKLDSLAAMIIEAQALGWEKDNREYVNDLQEILEFIRRLLPCEYKNIPVEEFKLLGLTAEELKARSHDPLKYYGHKHILVEYRIGALGVRLNTLRTASRETELAAAAAFKGPDGKPVREDIIKALNRISSLFYIMIFKYLPKGFEPRPAGI
jgi:ethanolamine utilization cobalamin adenosyltransferase